MKYTQDPLQQITQICRVQYVVTWNANAMQRDGCNYWLHRDCIGISMDEYNRPAGSMTCWICSECGLLNLSTSLFKGPTLDTANLYNPLDQTDSFSKSQDFTLCSVNSLGPPIHASSPNKPVNINIRIKKNSYLF